MPIMEVEDEEFVKKTKIYRRKNKKSHNH